jgi:chromosome segregation ATPase
MKSLKAPLCLSLVLLLAPAAAAPAQQAAAPAPAPPASSTVSADRSVEIIWEPSATPPDVTGVLTQLFGADADEIAARLLNVKPGARVLEIARSLEVKDHSCKVNFTLDIDSTKTGGRAMAKEIADALTERLPVLLLNARREQAEVRRRPALDEVRQLEFNLESLRRRVREKAAALSQAADRSDLTGATVQATIGKLEDERQRLELDLAGMEARLEAVQEQLKETADRAQKLAAGDPVIPELEKAVAAREKRFDITRKLYESGQAPQADVSQAEADLVETRVKLLDRRGAASARGADALTPLTRETQSLAIDIRDRKARLAQVHSRLKPLRDVAQDFQELAWSVEEEAALRRSWEDANVRLRETQRQIDVTAVDRVIVTAWRDISPSPAPGKQQQ